MGEPLARPDLITCSIGAERAAWVRASGFALSKAVQRLIDAERNADIEAERIASQTEETLAAHVKRVIDRHHGVQTSETLAALDKTARHPGDKLPDPRPPTPHGWTFTGTLQRQPDGTDRWVGQHIARPSSLDELSRLVSVAPGRVRLAASHVLIVSEVNDAS